MFVNYETINQLYDRRELHTKQESLSKKRLTSLRPFTIFDALKKLLETMGE